MIFSSHQFHLLWRICYYRCFLIPISSQNLSNSNEVYSPPLPLLSLFSLKSHCNSTVTLNFFKTTNTYDLFFRKYTQHIFDLSSMKVKKYLPLKVSHIGRQTYVCKQFKRNKSFPGFVFSKGFSVSLFCCTTLAYMFLISK